MKMGHYFFDSSDTLIFRNIAAKHLKPRYQERSYLQFLQIHLLYIYIYKPLLLLGRHDDEDAVRPPGALLAGVRRRHRPHLNISL